MQDESVHVHPGGVEPPKVELRLAGPEPRPQSEEHQARSASGHVPSLVGRRVVVCEDIGLVHLHVCRIVESAGMRIVGSARSAQEAVDTVLWERPDVVLMDINLPDFNGLEAARRILSEYHPCVIVLTAYGDQSLRDEAARLGAAGYVTKPVGRDELIREMERALARFEGQADDGS